MIKTVLAALARMFSVFAFFRVFRGYNLGVQDNSSKSLA